MRQHVVYIHDLYMTLPCDLYMWLAGGILSEFYWQLFFLAENIFADYKCIKVCSNEDQTLFQGREIKEYTCIVAKKHRQVLKKILIYYRTSSPISAKLNYQKSSVAVMVTNKNLDFITKSVYFIKGR